MRNAVLLVLISLSAAFAGQSDYTEYFRDTYEECRAKLRAFSDRAAGQLEAHHVPSSKGLDLAIETVWFPAAKTNTNLLVLVSGVHGAEAAVGSAVEAMFLDRILPGMDRSKWGVLLVHTANPFGFKHGRRVNELNVDLNRNFDTDHALFSEKNEGYEKVREFLNPATPAQATGLGTKLFPLKAVYYIARYSMKAMRQAAVQGQFVHPHGIYFGGKQVQPETEIVKSVLDKKAKEFQRIFLIDLHTGYGERGKLHFMATQIHNQRTDAATREVFRDYDVDYPGSEIVYPIHGDFVNYVVKRYADSKLIVPMTFEYGTLDSQTTMGSIRSIQNIVLENQGFQNGYRSESDRMEVEQRFREMFNPPSDEWRRRIIASTESVLKETLPRFAAVEEP